MSQFLTQALSVEFRIYRIIANKRGQSVNTEMCSYLPKQVITALKFSLLEL